MSEKGKVLSVSPAWGIAEGEIEITAENAVDSTGVRCFVGHWETRVIASTNERVLALVPHGPDGKSDVKLFNVEHGYTDTFDFNVGKKLVDDLHIVANPAIDPKDGTLITTISGGRGFQLPNTLFRVEEDGFIDALPVEIMNPTGIAFSPSGELFASNRSNGIVYRIDRGEEAVPFITGLGTATGIAFNQNGEMFVGDRGGKIYRVTDFGTAEVMAQLEPSVAAYHLAFGADSRLYVTAPGLASHDSIYAIDIDGNIETFARGFGRPQGIAFDTQGNLYVAACYKSRRGIIKVTPDGEASLAVSGNGIVGLCFDKKGRMFAATNNTIYRLDIGIYGNLL